MAREHDERGHEAWAVLLLGEIASHRDPSELKKAEGHYQQAMVLASNLGMRPLVGHCRLALGRLYRHAGKEPDALRRHLRTR